LGSRGCGKSTLLTLIAGFEQVSAGSIEVDGKPITRPGPDRGVVQQALLAVWQRNQRSVIFITHNIERPFF
jgi:NitT/TauT family transport system ATP-binding protein